MRAGGFLFCVWRLKGFTVGYPIIVMIYRSNPLVECMPLYGLRNAKSYTCNPPQFDLKKLFQKNLKKGLTKRGFCYILNKSSAMSHQNDSKTQQIAELCKGSTTDSDSVCEGSNPSSAATENRLFFEKTVFLLPFRSFPVTAI